MRVAALLAALALLTGCADQAGPTTVRVAAASDLQPALDLLEVDGVELQVTYGSSGTFLQQLVNVPIGSKVVCILSGGNVNLDQLKGKRWN